MAISRETDRRSEPSGFLGATFQSIVGGLNKRWLLSLLAVDGVLIAFHTLLGFLFVSKITATFPESLRIDRDWSVPEIFNYVKWALLLYIFLNFYRRSGALIFAGLAALCLLALADDSLQFHENFNDIFIVGTSLNSALPPGSGELIFFALVGIFCIAPLVVGWFKASRDHRDLLKPFLVLFAGFVFCVVVVDAIHTQLPEQSMIGGFFGILEDGGEMILLSMMLSYAVGTFWNADGRGGLSGAR